MDMEKPLPFDAECFGLETDSDFYNPLMLHEFDPLYEAHHLDNHVEKACSIHDAINTMKHEMSFAHTPMEDLVDRAYECYGLEKIPEAELKRILRKTKLIEKRQRAKRREKVLEVKKSFIPLHFESPIVEGSDDLKKQKNRLSAQISRDRKKQYYTKLQNENSELNQEIKKLQSENKELNEKLRKGNKNGTTNQGFLSLILFLGLIFFLDLFRSFFSSKKEAYNQVKIPKIEIKPMEKTKINKQLSELGVNLDIETFENSLQGQNVYVPKKVGIAIDQIVQNYL